MTENTHVNVLIEHDVQNVGACGKKRSRIIIATRDQLEQPKKEYNGCSILFKNIFGRRLQPTTKLTVLRFPNQSSSRKAPTTMVKLKISENLGFTKTYYKIEISRGGY